MLVTALYVHAVNMVAEGTAFYLILKALLDEVRNNCTK